ncbi:MAG: hypothetical protein ACREIC_04820 [Limisphaerales bacterium]
MNEPTKRITRDELYTEVWRTPVTELARTWSVSVAAIQRACARLNVPRPGQGHWPLVRRGWEMERTPLPPAGPKIPTETVIGWKWRSAAQPAKADAEQAKVPASEDLKSLHPLVKTFRSRLQKARIIAHGPLEVLAEEGNFNVCVSPAQLNRTMLILDTLVRELEARECSFVSAPFTVQTKAGTVNFRIWEKMRWEKVLVRQEPCGGGHINHWEDRYKTTGKLTFTITETHPRGGRKNWGDGERHRLEDKLGAVIEQILVNAAEGKEDWKRETQEREESQRRFYEEYLRRSAPERLEEMKKELHDQVEEQGKTWLRARGIREFLSACNQVMRRGREELPASSWESRWLAWGCNFADQLDPLTNGFLSSLEQRFKELEELEAFVAALPKESQIQAPEASGD